MSQTQTNPRVDCFHYKDLASEFVKRKSHDSSSPTNQRIVVTSCHACKLRTVAGWTILVVDPQTQAAFMTHS